MPAKNDSFIKTLTVAVVLCLVCSVLVSTTAVVLKAQQKENAALDKKRNVLVAANLFEKDTDIEAAFANIEKKFVDLDSGQFVELQDPQSFEQRKYAKDPNNSKPIEKDIARIGRRSNIAAVYLVKNQNRLQTIVLPVHGKGLFSTMYGFVALEADKQTVVGLKFYEQGETPGLGGEIDNPKWLSFWPGKKLLDDQGNPVIKLVKGEANKQNQVDAISGATMTTRGVQDLLDYWLGEDGFGVFLKRLNNKGEV